jgi:hypothetical protein
VNLSDTKGYAFDFSINVFPEVQVGDGEAAVGMILRSPRSAFFVPPRAVDRYIVMALLIHLGAMLDGFVEPNDPESDEGWVHFPELLMDVRQVYSPDDTVGLEISAHDCGCEDEREFNHGGYIPLNVERDVLDRELTALDSALRQKNAVGGGLGS